MPLLESFFLPHSPVLLPSIGKEHREVIGKTLKSLEKASERLQALKPHTLIVLSAHTNVPTPTFNINLSPTYKPSLEEFGDLHTTKEWHPDIELIHYIRTLGYGSYDLNLLSSEKLNYGIAVPLLMILKTINVKIVPITFARLPLPEMFRFGQFLHDIAEDSSKKISIIATGELSHHLSKTSPGGYSPKSKAFDQQVVRSLREKKPESLTKLSDKLLEQVGQCGLRALLILGGAFSKVNHKTEILSYESPFGVGYLSAIIKNDTIIS